MKAKEFTEKWIREPLVCYNETALRAYGLREEDLTILSKYGLPESAAPYLNFEEMNVQDIGYIEEGYFYLGYTGDGDWIGINTGSGKILVIAQDLDAYDDDDFAGDDEQEEAAESGESKKCEDYDYVGFTLMNTSLEALYECMLNYSTFLQKRLPEGSKEYAANVELLKEKLIETDLEAMRREDCFWNEEIKKLL